MFFNNVCVLICGKGGFVGAKRFTFLRNSPYEDVQYCRSGIFREVLIFLNFTKCSNSRILESHDFFIIIALLKKSENL